MRADVSDWHDLRESIDDAMAALRHVRDLLDWLDPRPPSGDRDGNVASVRKPMPR